MAETIKQDESQPAAFPVPPGGLSDSAEAIADAVWQRLEHYCAHRWSEREVVWTVEGPGEWLPPIAPAEIITTEIWRGDSYSETDLPPAPLGGFMLAGQGPYRITATVGADNDPPEAVLEAFRRLAEFLVAEAAHDKAGVRSVSVGDTSVNLERPGWMAKAIQDSGAGDLLRPYRRP